MTIKGLIKKVWRKIITLFPQWFPRIHRSWKGWWLSPLISGRYELAIAPESLISAEYISNTFSRYDAIVRYLAIEHYFGMNDFGFGLYEKMQQARGAPQGYEERFRHLIERVHQYGFDWKSTLDITRDGYLLDGSHRLALSLYYDVPAVAVRVHYRHGGPVAYGLDWFEKNGFFQQECRLIEQRGKELFWEKGLYFSIILWPPVADFFDQIEADVPYKIVESADYEFDEHTFEQKVRLIYEIDDIADWKVDKKLAHMAQYPKKLRVLWVELPDPVYRKKNLNNADISSVGEQLKSLLRRKYKEEVANYIYDIVCHTGDNWRHNRQICEIFGKC